MLSIKKLPCSKQCLLQLCGDIVKRHCQRCIATEGKLKLDPRIMALREKLVYCDYLDKEKVRMGFMKRKIKLVEEQNREQMERINDLMNTPTYSILLDNRTEKETPVIEECTTKDNNKPVHMPYASIDRYNRVQIVSDKDEESIKPELLNEKQKILYEKYLELTTMSGSKKNMTFTDYVDQFENTKTSMGDLSKVPINWMTDYEQFDDTLHGDKNWHDYYGTSNPDSPVSSIPCGGCGALLHCKDPGIPGYLPVELFNSGDEEDLKITTCQRCHFLKYYNTALEVKVSAEEYPKLLQVIKTKKCAVILLVDLTDFPCSIWPDIKTVLHPLTKIFLVGNKVDLLPRDSSRFFSHVQSRLSEIVQDLTGIGPKSVAHVSLISAKTGYGIEELINKLHTLWGNKGDIYMVGCTNVGKSSLFNALLNSDFCRVQAIDLVQRATISAWPGTTLNLLKFPMAYPGRRKLVMRLQRLQAMAEGKQLDEKYRVCKFKETGNIEYATLQGYIGRTFKDANSISSGDSFSEVSHEVACRKLGLDEARPELQHSRWCYDTPGTIHLDQVLDLLTTDELLTVLPDRIISPRTFVLHVGQTVFVGGIGRLDYVEGTDYIRCTLFASRNLPVTICATADADEIYKSLLTTEAFVVPTSNPERLKLWPALESKELSTTGIGSTRSAADVVLSSTGWIAITPSEVCTVTLRAWTPQGRGIHLRSPALLPKSVALRGKRIASTPMYKRGNEVYIKK